jgi:hypothetical protein
MTLRIAPVVLVACLVAGTQIHAQNVVLDQGSFSITINGTQRGTETFTIRRSGLGNQGTILAHGVVNLILDGSPTEIRPVLEAVPTDGTVTQYQVKVTGRGAMEGRLALAGNRYASQIRSPTGEEEREFLARPGTRLVDVMVAHQYYLLRSVRSGNTSVVIEPRMRRSVELMASEWVNEDIRLGPNLVSARRVTFSAGEDARTVWYDGQGRVLRVEIPALGYKAERQDLVG